jgi:DNA segregation ATPase FtsK/SpoIIIE-like protein
MSTPTFDRQPPFSPEAEVSVLGGMLIDRDAVAKAIEVVRDQGRASVSLLQRRLRIGYARAARLIDEMEEQGIIGPDEGGGRARPVLVTQADDEADPTADEE